MGSVYLLIRRRSAPVSKIYLWFPIRNQFYLFVPELEQVLFVCSKAGTSKMRLHDACLIRIKTNSLITHLLCVLGLCGPIRNLSILPHRALTVRGQALARRSHINFGRWHWTTRRAQRNLMAANRPPLVIRQSRLREKRARLFKCGSKIALRQVR